MSKSNIYFFLFIISYVVLFSFIAVFAIDEYFSYYKVLNSSDINYYSHNNKLFGIPWLIVSATTFSFVLLLNKFTIKINKFFDSFLIFIIVGGLVMFLIFSIAGDIASGYYLRKRGFINCSDVSRGYSSWAKDQSLCNYKKVK